MKNKNCCCFKDGINSDDGTEYEYCLFYCDTEFDCNLCEHTWLEKEQAMKLSELESELAEFNRMKNQNKNFINQLYDTWQTYKKLYDNSTCTHDAHIYEYIMRDIVYLYCSYINTTFEIAVSLFNCAYDAGIDTLC